MATAEIAGIELAVVGIGGLVGVERERGLLAGAATARERCGVVGLVVIEIEARGEVERARATDGRRTRDRDDGWWRRRRGWIVVDIGIGFAVGGQ